jgi:cytochrome c553
MSRPFFFTLILTLFSLNATAANGDKLYVKCAACHGKFGEFTEFGPAIKRMSEQEAREALYDYRAGKRNVRGQGSIMRGRVQGYSDTELNALAKHIGQFRK